ncbi:MAG: phytanoyl-CoA dioxygenase family protein [Pseudomonadales bacterium]|jgi:phytanoyl-CoA hydroxylase|nr:phytanoyl-CoA dioxygenase family protein [Pseudomonadales bacterium]MDA0956407.1 phytanoyl-CoA dioxygenase family protein [Pseudomonadota bacterium]MDA1206032.1 phytanoyl-CoA dioxygenase family protein [Pseudomonadota bacterium]
MKIDARSQNFVWSSPKGPYRRITEAQAAQWHRDGYFLLKNAIPKNAIDALLEDADRLEAAREAQLRQDHDGHFLINRAGEITFTIHIVKTSLAAQRFVFEPALVDLCLDLIGGDVRLYWDQLVYKKPETPVEFPWHQDNGYTYVRPENYLTCWVPLSPATIDNGCPWVVSGIHQKGTLEHWVTDLGYQCLTEADEANLGSVPIEADIGDVVVFSSLTPHRTGPNLTDNIRKAYIVQYAPDGAVMYPRQTDQALFQIDPDRHFPVCVEGQPAPCPNVIR